MSSECPVCIESYNTNARKMVCCAYCDYSACRKCVETYLLQHPTAKCMNCSKPITREQLVNTFTKKFVSTTFKTHREHCLFEQEKSMLPATQPIVEQLIENEKIKKKISDLRSQIVAIQEQIAEHEKELRKNTGTKEVERKAFIRKCPNSNCRGFLSTQWKCNLCQHQTCRDCNECIMDPNDEHKCNPANVETVKLLSSDSKPCPNCGELIFKIEGCDQIWCTQCHTPFSWRTGRVETGSIHNPHYFEWLRSQNRADQQAHLDIVPRCGREIDHHFVYDMTRKARRNTQMIIIARNLIHLREVVLPKFHVNTFNDNQDLRVSFLRNQIDEADFRFALQKREKAREKKTEYHRLFAMTIQCTTEIIYRYYEDIQNINLYTQEIQALVNYVNSCLANISKVYTCQRFTLSNDLHIYC